MVTDERTVALEGERAEWRAARVGFLPRHDPHGVGVVPATSQRLDDLPAPVGVEWALIVVAGDELFVVRRGHRSHRLGEVRPVILVDVVVTSPVDGERPEAPLEYAGHAFFVFGVAECAAEMVVVDRRCVERHEPSRFSVFVRYLLNVSVVALSCPA